MRTALVLGGAGCVWKDLDAALDLGEYQGVVTCNDITVAYPGKIDAAVSLHCEKWGAWISRRDARGYPKPDQIMGHKEAGSSTPRIPACVTGLTEYRLPGQQTTGSSGLFALKVALTDLGFDQAVLCGIPMSAPAGHFFDLTAWTACAAHQPGWWEVMPIIKDRARSMSGWTRDLLGAPDQGWLEAA